MKKIVLFAAQSDRKTLVRITDYEAGFAQETWLTPAELEHLLAQAEAARRKLQLLSKEGT